MPHLALGVYCRTHERSLQNHRPTKSRNETGHIISFFIPASTPYLMFRVLLWQPMFAYAVLYLRIHLCRPRALLHQAMSRHMTNQTPTKRVRTSPLNFTHRSSRIRSYASQPEHQRYCPLFYISIALHTI